MVFVDFTGYQKPVPMKASTMVSVPALKDLLIAPILQELSIDFRHRPSDEVCCPDFFAPLTFSLLGILLAPTSSRTVIIPELREITGFETNHPDDSYSAFDHYRVSLSPMR